MAITPDCRGMVYAKILEDLWTEISPSGSYWNPTRVISDNRIAAMETASSEYSFSAPEARRSRDPGAADLPPGIYRDHGLEEMGCA